MRALTREVRMTRGFRRWRRCSSCKKEIGFTSDLLGLQRLDLQPQAHRARVLHDVVLGRPPAAHEPPRGLGRGAPRAHARGVAARAGGRAEGGAPPPRGPRPRPRRRRRRRRRAPPRRRAPAEPEILVVVSKLKAYVRERSGMSTSDSVSELLSDRLRRMCDEAIQRAAARRPPHGDGPRLLAAYPHGRWRWPQSRRWWPWGGLLGAALLVSRLIAGALRSRAPPLPDRWREARAGWLYRSAQIAPGDVERVPAQRAHRHDPRPAAPRTSTRCATPSAPRRASSASATSTCPSRSGTKRSTNLAKAVAEIERARRRGDRVWCTAPSATAAPPPPSRSTRG